MIALIYNWPYQATILSKFECILTKEILDAYREKKTTGICNFNSKNWKDFFPLMPKFRKNKWKSHSYK